MDKKIVTVIFGLFLIILFATTATTSPASSRPVLDTDIRIEVDSIKLDKALMILEKHPEYKEYVEDKIKVIKKGKLTRITYPNGEPTVEITDRYLNDHGLIWLASTMVHEARHVEQAQMRLVMTDQEIELDANRVQATALYFMGADKKAIDHLIAQDGLHFDTNGNGILDKDDNWGW